MQLESKHAFFGTFCGFIRHVHGQLAVDEVLEVAAFGDDLIFIPTVFIDRSLDFIAVTSFSGDGKGWFLWVGTLSDSDLLATLGKDPPAFFLIKNATVFRTVLEICLIAGDDEICFINDLATVLDTAVDGLLLVARGHLVLERELEIGNLTVFPDEEGIALYRSVCAGFADEDAVLHRPEGGISVPAGEILAVEELLLCGGGEGRGEREEDDGFHDDDLAITRVIPAVYQSPCFFRNGISSSTPKSASTSPSQSMVGALD